MSVIVRAQVGRVAFGRSRSLTGMLYNYPLSTLVLGLRGTKTFEEAARMMLAAMLTVAGDSLAKSPLSPRARLLRGVIHLRPDDGYQRIFGIEHKDGSQVEGTGYLTSANVWRWVSEHGTAVSIDVQSGTLSTWQPKGASAPHKLPPVAAIPGPATRDRMARRETTHVHVVPLCALPAGKVIGMITLEASCQAAQSATFIWGDCRDELCAIAIVASPHLATLPTEAQEEPQADSLAPVIGPPTAGLMRILSVFASQEETLLLGGPTGVGKSRMARWCHAHSPRRDQVFETVRLLGVPEELQMAELLGWRRGAFTGAVRDTPGALSRAARGTLFIDEIDKLSLKAQAGLLQVLEERRFRRLGDSAGEMRADVRFIVSTNIDLAEAVRAGRFREDLYYRINVLPIRLPSLAERLEELPQWAEYMLKRRHTEALGAGAPRIAAEAMQLLLRTPWPGNLRQLDNIIRRAYAMMLADQLHAQGPIVLTLRHMEEALGYEHRPSEEVSLIASLWRAARVFVDEAEKRAADETRLSLDSADGFRGLVLCAAIERRGREAAFALLDQASLLRNRNHHRVLRREIERARALMEAVPGDVEASLSVILASLEEQGS